MGNCVEALGSREGRAGEIWAAEEGSRDLRWLFVTSEFPWPLNHGTWLRVYHLARMLRARGDEVAVLCHGGDEAGRAKYAEAGIRILAGPAGSALYKGKSRCFLGPYVFDRLLAECLREAAGGYDVTVLVRPCMLQYAEEAAGAGCVLADMVDDPMLEEGRQLWTELNPSRLVCRLKFLAGELLWEGKYLKRVDLSLFVSGQDAGNFLSRHPGHEVTWVPNGVELGHFSRPESDGRAGEVPVVSFVGNMVHPPNEEAALYLLRRIAPLVWREEPETRFMIIGSHPSRRLCELAGPKVEVTGWVEDVRPLLWGSTAAVLPMRTGTGIKNKLLEAWAAGLAVVATPLAGQGVSARDGENVLLGSSSDELAGKLVGVIRDAALRERIGRGGQATVRRHLSWQRVARQFREVALEVRGGKKVRRV